MNLEIRQLSIRDEDAFFSGLNTFSDMEKSWYASHYNVGMSFHQYLEMIDKERLGIDLLENRVPATLLYAFLDGKIVGRVGIRHMLNDFLYNIGGHIGYVVATNYRGKGIATLMLKEALIYSKNILKLDRTLITCDDDNLASINVIEKCGGVLEDRYISPDGIDIKRRYWISL
jgi:predicted acetyltransferase